MGLIEVNQGLNRSVFYLKKKKIRPCLWSTFEWNSKCKKKYTLKDRWTYEKYNIHTNCQLHNLVMPTLLYAVWNKWFYNISILPCTIPQQFWTFGNWGVRKWFAWLDSLFRIWICYKNNNYNLGYIMERDIWISSVFFLWKCLK